MSVRTQAAGEVLKEIGESRSVAEARRRPSGCAMATAAVGSAVMWGLVAHQGERGAGPLRLLVLAAVGCRGGVRQGCRAAGGMRGL